MEQLPLKLKINGLILKQVKRTDKVAMYSVHHPDKSEDLCAYEVIKIQHQKEGVMIRNGIEFKMKEKEKLPGNSHFGSQGWSFATLEQAEKKWEELSV